MENIKKVLLLGSLIGLLLLIFLTTKIEPKTTVIINITNSSLDKQVRIEGNIIKIQNYVNDTFHILTFNDTSGKIQVIFNSKNPKKIEINSSFNYSAKGKVSRYNQTLQISADKIELLG